MGKSDRVVIVGAGFGGFQAAQSLADSGAEVVLVDRNNYHTFVPLLYQVATAQIEPAQIAYPIRTILRRSPNVRFLRAEVTQVDFTAQTIETDSFVIPYDYLVLATGSRTQFLGVPGASEYTFSMRSLEEAVALRNHILRCFEQATQETEPLQRQQLLTFAIVGGGPTGVEVAGALVELIRGPLRRDYPMLDLRQVRIVLLQSSDRLLADLPKKLGDYTSKRLRRIGVEVYLHTRVEQVTQEEVYLQDGQVISAATTIWTAGQEASVPRLSGDVAAANKGKLIVRPTLQLLERSNVYAIGDVAYIEQNGKPLTGVAPEALQQGVAVARNLKRQLRGKTPQPFRYFNKGRLAIIGCYSGVGKIGSVAFTGFLAWFMWLGVHLVYLPGFRNRLLILLTWVHGYILGDRPIRLILPAVSASSRSRQLLKAKKNFVQMPK